MNLREAGRMILWFALGAAVVAIPILLQQSAQRAAPVVRSYTVDPGIAREMRVALAEALSSRTKDGPAVGSVSQTPDGQLLVTAPTSVQKDVERILAEVAARKPAPTPAIRFEVWLVSAVPGASVSDDGPGVTEIAPALADIQKSKGPLHLELMEKLALTARAGTSDWSEVKGAHAEMQVMPTVRQNAKGEPVIAARVHLYTHAPTPYVALQALTELRPGQLLVIGQSSLAGRGAGTPDSQLYYIVRASL